MTKEKINKTSCSGISSRLNSQLLHNVLLATNHLGLKQPQNMGHILCATNPLKRSWAHYNQLSLILKHLPYLCLLPHCDGIERNVR